MQLKEFFEGIRMIPEAAAQALRLSISEEEYQDIRTLFYNDRPLFYEKVLCKRDFRILFLYYYSRMACETYGRYRELNIGDTVFWDTFYDLTLWCENCRKEYGEYGINQYDWFFRHIECTIFRLGRLEFEKMDSQWELKGVKRAGYGETAIHVHIPQGERLDIPAVQASFGQAFLFWGKQHPYICHSWLLYPGLKEILPPQSNIIRFQNLFQISDIDFREREGEWRIFGGLFEDASEYPENTSLQRAAKQYLLAGNKLGNGVGIYAGT
ncbi:MAG: acyltransferase domain-containing protein [Lachnospiraceae bacterium]|nr:acyltransferase domain-containing protein [Lachnospiraceae bacterium]